MAKKKQIDEFTEIEVSKNFLLSLFNTIDKKIEEYEEEAFNYNREKKMIPPRNIIAQLHVIKVDISNIKTKIKDIKKKSKFQLKIDKLKKHIEEFDWSY